MPQVEQDIALMVGGRFSPDSLGPDVYNATLERARSHAPDYLRVFESLYLGLNFDAFSHSNLYLPSFLEHLRDRDPAVVDQAATRLARMYDAVLVVYDAASDREKLFELLPERTVRLIQRLTTRRMELRVLTQVP